MHFRPNFSQQLFLLLPFQKKTLAETVHYIPKGLRKGNPFQWPFAQLNSHMITKGIAVIWGANCSFSAALFTTVRHTPLGSEGGDLLGPCGSSSCRTSRIGGTAYKIWPKNASITPLSSLNVSLSRFVIASLQFVAALFSTKRSILGLPHADVIWCLASCRCNPHFQV